MPTDLTCPYCGRVISLLHPKDKPPARCPTCYGLLPTIPSAAPPGGQEAPVQRRQREAEDGLPMPLMPTDEEMATESPSDSPNRLSLTPAWGSVERGLLGVQIGMLLNLLGTALTLVGRIIAWVSGSAAGSTSESFAGGLDLAALGASICGMLVVVTGRAGLMATPAIARAGGYIVVSFLASLFSLILWGIGIYLASFLDGPQQTGGDLSDLVFIGVAVLSAGVLAILGELTFLGFVAALGRFLVDAVIGEKVWRIVIVWMVVVGLVVLGGCIVVGLRATATEEAARQPRSSFPKVMAPVGQPSASQLPATREGASLVSVGFTGVAFLVALWLTLEYSNLFALVRRSLEREKGTEPALEAGPSTGVR